MSLDDEFDRLLAGARADDAARSRAAVTALRERAAEDATIAGVLADLADRRSRVRLTVRGSPISGAVVEVTTAGVVLVGTGVVSIVRLDAVEAVTCHDGHHFDGDDRRATAMSWAGLLQDRLERGDHIVVTSSGTTTRGTVRTIGLEVVVLRTSDGSSVYARTGSLDVVSIADGTSRVDRSPSTD